jgi:hypothetical protein
VLLAFTLRAATGSANQITSKEVFDPQEGIYRTVQTIEGEALPTYVSVEALFLRASQSLKPPARWSRFLGRLGMVPGSASAQTFLKAVRTAQVFLLPAPGVTAPEPISDPVEFLEKQVAHARDKVSRLASVYGNLLVTLQTQGYAIEKLDAYLDEQVRPGLSITPIQHPDDPEGADATFLEALHEFDAKLAEVVGDRLK